jgi:hypothetical protein
LLSDVPAPDVSGWWDADELETCPLCGDKTLAPSSPGLDAAHFGICVQCGLIDTIEVKRLAGCGVADCA